MDTTEAPHLLSVEDNPDTRLLLKHLLEPDYQVTFASTVEEALDLLGSGPSFDLLLIDINLDGQREGTELLRLTRKRDDLDGAPAIAVTAYAMPGDEEELLRGGFDGYVGKPFTADELTGVVDQVLQPT